MGVFMDTMAICVLAFWWLKAFCWFDSGPHVTALLTRILSILRRTTPVMNFTLSVTTFARLQSTIRLDSKTVKSLSSNNAVDI